MVHVPDLVTKSSVRWMRSDLGTQALTREVTALRCGLDVTVWYGEGLKKCATSLGISLDKAPGPNEPLPFDHARAYKLYAALFGDNDLIKHKHLLLVPSGPLALLPFHVLITRPRLRVITEPSPGWLRSTPLPSCLPPLRSLRYATSANPAPHPSQ